MSALVSAVSARRSQYALSDAAALPDAEIVDLVRSVAGEVPSAFNSQPQRVIVLFGAEHHRLWTIVHDALRAVVKDDTAFAATEQKIAGFDAAHGTVLYFSVADRSLALHALLIAVFVAITVPIMSIFLMRAALFRARQAGRDVPPSLSQPKVDGSTEAKDS